GMPAQHYPRICKDTCERWSEASGVQEAGLPVPLTLCASCPHSKGETMCSYMRLRAEAKTSPHLVVTSHRAALDPTDMLGSRDAALFVFSDPQETLHPTEIVPVAPCSDDHSISGQFLSGIEALETAARLIPQILDCSELRCREEIFWRRIENLACQVEEA